MQKNEFKDKLYFLETTLFGYMTKTHIGTSLDKRNKDFKNEVTQMIILFISSIVSLMMEYYNLSVTEEDLNNMGVSMESVKAFNHSYESLKHKNNTVDDLTPKEEKINIIQFLSDKLH